MSGLLFLRLQFPVLSLQTAKAFNREGREGDAKAAKKSFLGLVFFASLAAFLGELHG